MCDTGMKTAFHLDLQLEKPVVGTLGREQATVPDYVCELSCRNIKDKGGKAQNLVPLTLVSADSHYPTPCLTLWVGMAEGPGDLDVLQKLMSALLWEYTETKNDSKMLSIEILFHANWYWEQGSQELFKLIPPTNLWLITKQATQKKNKSVKNAQPMVSP